MAITTAIAAVASTGYSIYQGEQQKKAQRKQLALQSQANEDARKQAKAQAGKPQASIGNQHETEKGAFASGGM